MADVTIKPGIDLLGLEKPGFVTVECLGILLLVCLLEGLADVSPSL